jgi:tetratricopeptide (TPR) repeat protein
MRNLLAEVYEYLTGARAPQPVVGTELSSIEWSNKGTSLDRLGRPEEALACCDHALTLNPRHVEVWSNKGAALATLGRPEEALACCDHALTLDPHDARVWYDKGTVLCNNSQHREALTCFEEAVTLHV